MNARTKPMRPQTVTMTVTLELKKVAISGRRHTMSLVINLRNVDE